MKNENIRVPKLRFKEFSGEWEEKTLGNLADIKTGNRDTQDKVDNGTYPFFVRSQTIERINSYSFDGEAILTAGDGVGVGKVFHYLNEKFDYHQRVYNIHNFKNNVFGKYIFFYFSENFYKRVIRLSAKNSVDSVRMEMISKMLIPLPQKQEQEKIASFLSSIDKKINQLSKKDELLQNYKKAMMQKIFSQKLRFKKADGSDYTKWEEKKLNQITKVYDGTHSTPKYVKSGVPFYSVEHVTANQFEETKYISEKVFEKENERVKLEKNDILMTRIGDIGTSRLIDWDVRASFYVSLALIKNNKNFSSSFLNQFIKSDYFQRQLYSKTLHVAFPKKINLGEIGECLIKLPSLEEQIKIANFLSSLDTKISQNKKALEETQKFKKALLQKMFV
ncbi:restriction endonuclease subunit S [Halarcobacter anaerophilus]|uniref:Type I restriction modification DNA specificity domain-containing protein n=1 Tax=Halarcobacter anaerophilus TaxID=877500 RepID=A0A4Q0Y0E6_9BACT|nr:restriction endonuclease subunit S [Halarcobacter anaerophilus]QDF28704.1 type I restriction/modification system, specificity subunit [Halarcobacter anaerophilus]RXJ63422.1 hypothetical protein CRV06_07030 [Halarcobacter anaerophilus]